VLLAGSNNSLWRQVVKNVVDISLIIVSIALITSVILQSKGAGLGGLTGADTGGIFTARRGVEKSLFYVTIVLSLVFFVLAVLSVIAAQ
jgi:preprotein translocase subunit SecG